MSTEAHEYWATAIGVIGAFWAIAWCIRGIIGD